MSEQLCAYPVEVEQDGPCAVVGSSWGGDPVVCGVLERDHADIPHTFQPRVLRVCELPTDAHWPHRAGISENTPVHAYVPGHRCEECMGKGWVVIPGSVPDQDECPSCHGLGAIADEVTA